MKLTYILLFFALFQLQANTSYSQNVKVTLDCNQMNIEEVLNEIERKTDFKFLYEKDVFKKNKVISISSNKEKLSNILENLFEADKVEYKVFDKQIVLHVKGEKLPLLRLYKERISKLLFQQYITGKVTDQKGNPLPGATVYFKRKTKGRTFIGVATNANASNNTIKFNARSRGTVTDFNGNFRIQSVDGAKTLVVSYIGYETKEVDINDEKSINIQLDELVTGLDEMVVIGYGRSKKKDLTGSVGTVDVENLTNQAPTINLDNALQGQIAGVYVSSATGQPGAAARIRIRGTTSLLGSNQPLYVIDGIPVAVNSNIPVGGAENFTIANTLNQRGLSTPIGNINSSDIESISVLKDASAAAIYGSRAANGVIIINTKQGSYASKPKFDASVSFSTQTAQTLEVLNSAQYKEVWVTAIENRGTTDAFSLSILDGSYFGDADTNWEDEITRNAPLTSVYNFSVTGGSSKTRYSTSLGVNTQEGAFDNSAFDRYSFNLNLDSKINEKWMYGTKMNVSFTDQEAPDGGITQLIYNFRPDLPVFDENGNYSFSTRFNQQNPVALSKATNNNKTLLLLGSIYAQLEITESLSLKTLLSMNYNNGNQKSFYPLFTNGGGFSRLGGGNGYGDGYAQESRSLSTNTMWQNTLTFNKSYGVHNINSVLGISFEESKSSFVKGWGEGFFNDVLTNITSATTYTESSSFETGSGLSSYFGRVNYDYDDKYLLTLSARVDGSSKFAPGNQYAFFPAAAVAWRLTEETFLEDVTFLDELKLRASMGTTGQQDFGDYAWRTLFETNDYAQEPAYIFTQLGNNSLKWETTNQLDLGLDFSLLKGRLSGGIGYYVKDTKDALFTAITPGSTGTNRIIANIGNTQNKGYELELNVDIIRSKDFNWNVSLNISKNENKLTKISDDFLGDDGFLTGFPGGGRLKEGSSIGLIYGYVSEGIFTSPEEIEELNTNSPTGTYQNSLTSVGDLKFKDLTGPDGVPDGRITNLDQQAIGDTQPDFFGGINNTISYKGFSLSTFFTFSVGNDLDAFGLARGTNFGSTFFGENKITSVLDAWTTENPNSNIPRIVYLDPNDNDRTSTHYVYDASYIRLKTLNLSYSFSEQLMEKIKILDRFSIFMTAQNLLTITDYPGADPEASNLYNNDISAGRDNNRFPIAKVFTAGLRIGF